MVDRITALLVVATAAAVAAAAVSAAAHADRQTERFALAPNGTPVTATAAIEHDTLTVSVAGAPAGARITASVDHLACGAGFTLRRAGGTRADAAGNAAWVADNAVAGPARDGWHVLSLRAAGRTIACGTIPTVGPAAAPPPSRHWGFWAFTRRLVD